MAQQIHAKDKGVIIKIGCNEDLTGNTVTLTIVDPQGTTTTGIPMTIGTGTYTNPQGIVYQDGHWATMTTVATNFPDSGDYILQVQLDNGTTIDIVSDDINITVLPRRG